MMYEALDDDDEAVDDDDVAAEWAAMVDDDGDGDGDGGEDGSSDDDVAAEWAAMAEEDGDDEDYAGYAKKMKSGALDLLDAVKLNDPNRAASAVGVMTQSCTECHELYRS